MALCYLTLSAHAVEVIRATLQINSLCQRCAIDVFVARRMPRAAVLETRHNSFMFRTVAVNKKTVSEYALRRGRD